jgi:hypothetical protein
MFIVNVCRRAGWGKGRRGEWKKNKRFKSFPWTFKLRPLAHKWRLVVFGNVDPFMGVRETMVGHVTLLF